MNEWVGGAPNAAFPAFLYVLLQLLCIGSFTLLRLQLVHDNPSIRHEEVGHALKVVPCVLFVACLPIIPFYPPISLWVTGIGAVFILAYIVLNKRV